MKPQNPNSKIDKLLLRFVSWREKHVSERAFVMFLALVTGALSGAMACVLKMIIHTIAGIVQSHVSPDSGNYLYIVAPAIGIILVVLYVKYLVRDNITHGVTRVLYALSQNKSRLKRHNMYTSVIANSLTIGFGGSVGSEGPMVATGAAIGSNIGQAFRMSPRILMILVGCGSAAGIAGIFKAPIAGMLFTLEVLMIDLTTVSVMPLLIASITGATVAYAYTGYEFEFFFVQSDSFTITLIPYALALGVVCGLTAIYFTKVMNMMESMFHRIRRKITRILIGGTIMCLLVFLFPPLYGEGYSSITQMLTGDASALVNGSIFYAEGHEVWFLALFVLAVILAKGFATSATNGAGGVGGTFAPSLFVGAMTGFLFAFVANQCGIEIELSTKNFALIGMTGLMSGVMHAPLMAIFLVAELTGGYQLFLPLLIVSTVSYGVSKMFLPYSIYAMRLAQRGELLTHHKDKAVLTLLKVHSVIENDFLPVSPDMNLKQMVDTISKSHRNLFPVLDSEKRLVGVVVLDEIRNIMFRPDLYRKMYVSKFMGIPPERITETDTMETVMRTFDRTGAWNLPVVDSDGRYVGFVSKSKIFNSYRRVLRHYCED